MKVYINFGDFSKTAKIVRLLYYATGFENLEVYVGGIKKKSSFVRYSRIPVWVAKEKIKFEFPRLEGKVYVLDPNGKEDIEDIDVLIIDETREYRFEKVRGVGFSDLFCEAIAFFYKKYLRKREFKITVDEDIKRENIYIAKKILDCIESFDILNLVSPRRISFVLKHVFKKYDLLIDLKEWELKYNYDGKYYILMKFEIFDKDLNKICEAYGKLENNILELPIYENGKIVYKKFQIDFDRKRVYINKNYYVSKEGEIPLFFPF